MLLKNLPMSPRSDTERLMAELLRTDAEKWASLRGLMAMLALPPVTGPGGVQRRREVEVEIAPGVWQVVDSIAIEEHPIRFWSGSNNGHKTEYTFLRLDNAVPKWRVEQQQTRVVAP